VADVEIRGLDDAIAALNRKLEDLTGLTVRGIEDVALDLLRRSVMRAPLDKGDLRGSGQVIMGSTVIAKGAKDGSVMQMGSASATDTPEATVAYGMPYAAKMHNDRTYRPRQPGTGPGYLADPLRENGQRYVQHIAESFRRSLM